MSSEDDLPIISKKKRQPVKTPKEETPSTRLANSRKRKSSNRLETERTNPEKENISRSKKSPREKKESKKKIKEERISVADVKFDKKIKKKKMKLEAGSQDSINDETPSVLFEKGDARRYFKPYQKEMCPPNGDATRGFYESLLEENPNSLIAIKFCVEFGCLVGSRLKCVLEKYEKLKEAGLLPASFSGGKKPQAEKLLCKSEEEEESE